MMSRLFSQISSHESTLDQRNNEQSTSQQPKKDEDQISKHQTKHEANLCARCKSSFKTSRGLIHYQKKCKPRFKPKWFEELVNTAIRKPGKEYIDESTHLILKWVNDNQLQSVAIKALRIMLLLILQNGSRNSKSKDHTESLRRRLKL